MSVLRPALGKAGDDALRIARSAVGGRTNRTGSPAPRTGVGLEGELRGMIGEATMTSGDPLQSKISYK